MKALVTGTLARTEIDAVVGDRVYTRWLYFQLADGKELCVFDDASLGNHLAMDTSYDLLLSVFIPLSRVRYWSIPPANMIWRPLGLKGALNALILELDWQPPQLPVRPAPRPGTQGQPEPRMLLETAIGCMMTTHRTIAYRKRVQLTMGGYLAWDSARYDLRGARRANGV